MSDRFENTQSQGTAVATPELDQVEFTVKSSAIDKKPTHKKFDRASFGKNPLEKTPAPVDDIAQIVSLPSESIENKNIPVAKKFNRASFVSTPKEQNEEPKLANKTVDPEKPIQYQAVNIVTPEISTKQDITQENGMCQGCTGNKCAGGCPLKMKPVNELTPAEQEILKDVREAQKNNPAFNAEGSFGAPTEQPGVNVTVIQNAIIQDLPVALSTNQENVSTTIEPVTQAELKPEHSHQTENLASKETQVATNDIKLETFQNGIENSQETSARLKSEASLPITEPDNATNLQINANSEKELDHTQHDTLSTAPEIEISITKNQVPHIEIDPTLSTEKTIPLATDSTESLTREERRDAEHLIDQAEGIKLDTENELSKPVDTNVKGHEIELEVALKDNLQVNPQMQIDGEPDVKQQAGVEAKLPLDDTIQVTTDSEIEGKAPMNQVGLEIDGSLRQTETESQLTKDENPKGTLELTAETNVNNQVDAKIDSQVHLTTDEAELVLAKEVNPKDSLEHEIEVPHDNHVDPRLESVVDTSPSEEPHLVVPNELAPDLEVKLDTKEEATLATAGVEGVIVNDVAPEKQIEVAEATETIPTEAVTEVNPIIGEVEVALAKEAQPEHQAEVLETTDTIEANPEVETATANGEIKVDLSPEQKLEVSEASEAPEALPRELIIDKLAKDIASEEELELAQNQNPIADIDTETPVELKAEKDVMTNPLSEDKDLVIDQKLDPIIAVDVIAETNTEPTSETNLDDQQLTEEELRLAQVDPKNTENILDPNAQLPLEVQEGIKDSDVALSKDENLIASDLATDIKTDTPLDLKVETNLDSRLLTEEELLLAQVDPNNELEINTDKIVDPKAEITPEGQLVNNELELAQDPNVTIISEIPLELNPSLPIDPTQEIQAEVNPELTEEMRLVEETDLQINPELIAGTEIDSDIIIPEELQETDVVDLELQNIQQEVNPELEATLATEPLPEDLLDVSPETILEEELQAVIDPELEQEVLLADVVEPEAEEEMLLAEAPVAETDENMVLAVEKEVELEAEMELAELQTVTPEESIDQELETAEVLEAQQDIPEDQIDTTTESAENIISAEELTRLVDEITVEMTNNLVPEDLGIEIEIPESKLADLELQALIEVIQESIDLGNNLQLTIPEDLKELLAANPEDSQILLVNLIDLAQASDVNNEQLSNLIRLLNQEQELEPKEIISNLDSELTGLLSGRLDDLSVLEFKELFSKQIPDLSTEELLNFMLLMQTLKKSKGKLEDLTLEEQYLLQELLASNGEGTTLEELSPEELEELIQELKAQIMNSLLKSKESGDFLSENEESVIA